MKLRLFIGRSHLYYILNLARKNLYNFVVVLDQINTISTSRFFCVQFLFFSGSNLVTTFAIKSKTTFLLRRREQQQRITRNSSATKEITGIWWNVFIWLFFFQKTEIVWKKASKFAFLQRKRSQNNSASSIFFSLKIIIFGANFETFSISLNLSFTKRHAE